LEEKEFVLHVKIIKDFLSRPQVRLILFHNPYTKAQQRIIDIICMNHSHIIGQVVRKEPNQEALSEISRLLESHHEPFVTKEKMKFVIIGQQKPKI